MPIIPDPAQDTFVAYCDGCRTQTNLAATTYAGASTELWRNNWRTTETSHGHNLIVTCPRCTLPPRPKWRRYG